MSAYLVDGNCVSGGLCNFIIPEPYGVLIASLFVGIAFVIILISFQLNSNSYKREYK